MSLGGRIICLTHENLYLGPSILLCHTLCATLTQNQSQVPGVENVSDHGTIGPRKFWGSQKRFQIRIYKIFEVKQILRKKHEFPDNTLHCTTLSSASVENRKFLAERFC